MGEISGEEAGPGWSAGRRGDMALVERDAFSYEPVRARRIQVRETELRDGIVALLIRDNEDDIGAFHKRPWYLECLRDDDKTGGEISLG